MERPQRIARSSTRSRQTGPDEVSRADSALSSREARDLLRSLRDVNIAARLSLDEQWTVELEGCSTAFAPVSGGVAYRLRLSDGSVAEFTIKESAHGFQLELTGEGPLERTRTLFTYPRRGADGRLRFEGLSARIDPQRPVAQSLERFLRRALRELWAA